MKKPVPSAWWNLNTADQWLSPMLKIQPMATNVSGTMEMTPRIVANTVPKRIPRYAGMKSNSRPTIEMPSVHHAMNVWIGVKPLCERSSLSTM